MSAMASAVAFYATAFSPVFQSFAYHQGGAACSASRRLRHVRINPAQPYPVAPSLAGNSGGVMTRAPGFSIHAVKRQLGLVHSFAGQLLSQKIADLDHSTNCLSQKPSLDGSRTIEKAFGDGRISFGGQQIVFPG